MAAIDDIVKKPRQKSDYTYEQYKNLTQSVEDPLFFMQKFMKVQHPTKGMLNFKPYAYQERMINAFHNHRFTTVLAARQLGKTLVSNSTINKDGKSIKIGTLIPLSFKERIVEYLEKLLIKISTNTK